MTDSSKTNVLPFLKKPISPTNKNDCKNDSKYVNFVRRDLEQRHCQFPVVVFGFPKSETELPEQLKDSVKHNFEFEVGYLSVKIEGQMENMEDKISEYNRRLSYLYYDILKEIEGYCVDGKLQSSKIEFLIHSDSNYSYHSKDLDKQLNGKLKYITQVTNFFEKELFEKGYKSYIKKTTENSSPDFEGDIRRTQRIFFVIEKI